MANSDLLSLLPEIELENRRAFLVTKLAVGFAMAVRPVGAQTITTDTKGLTAGEVKIPTSDEQIPAYRAMPVSGRNFRSVWGVMEFFAANNRIKNIYVGF